MKLSSLALVFLLGTGYARVVSDDLQNAYQNLKNAEAQKDAVLVKKTALELWALVRQVTAVPVPTGEAEKDAWTSSVAYARDLEVQIEYALMVTALQAPPAVTVELLSTLEQHNPKSKYLDEAYGRYLL